MDQQVTPQNSIDEGNCSYNIVIYQNTLKNISKLSSVVNNDDLRSSYLQDIAYCFKAF